MAGLHFNGCYIVAKRFRKSIKIAPGVRINISKSGVSTSVGVRGATANFSKRGTRVTTGIPGTGISSSQLYKSNKSKRNIRTDNAEPSPTALVVTAVITGLAGILLWAQATGFLSWVGFFLVAASVGVYGESRAAKRRGEEAKRLALELIEREAAEKLAAEHQARLDAVSKHILEAGKYAERMLSVKTATARINNAEKALAAMQAAAEYPERYEVIPYCDGMIFKLQAIIKVTPVIESVEKAYRHKFKGNDKAELRALLDALYSIRTGSITNEDILASELMPSGTGEIVQVENIERRCRELGWEG